MEAGVADPRPVVRDARPGDAGRIVRFQQAMALETEAKTLDAAQQTYRRLGMDHSHYDLYETDFQL